MTAERKAAYRYLLYAAMIDIRTMCPYREPESQEVAKWQRVYGMARKAGALADWLHNLASTSVNDFAGFDEEAFWRSPDGVTELAGYKEYYRNQFERYLAEQVTK